jgi:zinc transporter ZupT
MHEMTPVLLTVATALSTLLGGFFAFRLRDRLHMIQGFAAGVLVGVVAFEILPEIISQVQVHGFEAREIMVALVGGFLAFHIFEKLLIIHHAQEGHYAEHHHPGVGALSALALSGHSFMDGLGIGLGFQMSNAVGVTVAVAVISHDFTDGMNTVAVTLTNRNAAETVRRFLFLDAAAPMLGVLCSTLISVSPHFLVLYLGAFGGFLLYIGASDILPEAHSRHSSGWTILMTILGAALAFTVSKWV